MIQNLNIDQIFQTIEKVLNENPEPIQNSNVVYQFELAGDDGGTYQLHLSDGQVKVEKGTSIEATCSLQMKVSNFKDFLLGSLNGPVAFMTGKLKIKGSISEAMKLENLLQQYDLKNY